MNSVYVLLVGLGGAIGSMFRFCCAEGIHHFFERGFPLGTLFVNVTGSFLIGFLSLFLLSRFPQADAWRSLILIGFLGGYTTFSTFSMDTINLLLQGHITSAILNILLSVICCLAATLCGVILANQLV